MSSDVVQVIDNFLSKDCINTLKRFFLKKLAQNKIKQIDKYVHIGIDKNWIDCSDIELDQWPSDIVHPLLCNLHTKPFRYDRVFFYKNTGSFCVHADTVYNKQTNELQYNIVIPLETIGECATVYFKNYWYGDHAGFDRQKPDSINRESSPEQFSQITNLNGQDFDKNIYNKYLSHCTYDDLHGFSLDCVVPWKVGSAIISHRNQLHASASTHKERIFLVIFTSSA